MDAYGRLTIPPQWAALFREGFLPPKYARIAMRQIANRAFGSGGVLEDHLQQAQSVKLNPAYLRWKAKRGYGSKNLVAKYGRIKQAVSRPTSKFRKTIISARKGKAPKLSIRFNNLPRTKGGNTPIDKILQGGRVSGATYSKGKKQIRQSREQFVAASKGRNKAANRFLKAAKGLGYDVQVHKTNPMPIMQPQERDSGKVDPAVEAAISHIMKLRGIQ